jgi:hypothetical protein
MLGRNDKQKTKNAEHTIVVHVHVAGVVADTADHNPLHPNVRVPAASLVHLFFLCFINLSYLFYNLNFSLKLMFLYFNSIFF